MTEKEVLDIFSKIKYKEDVTMHLVSQSDYGNDINLYLYRLVKDATGQNEYPIKITSRNSLCLRTIGSMTERAFIEWVYRCLFNFEVHEMDEWFKYNNIAIKDPHKELR